MRINNHNHNQNFKGFNFAKPLEQFYNANATIPTLIIESGVTLGRAYEANKRGGIPEAKDRLIEQGISAVVWIYGVKALKNIGDFIGKKLLKIENLDFDIGFDELRNPTKYIDKKSLGFKAGNILVSTALATFFIGAILPKINNAILDKTLKKEKEKEKKKNNIREITFSDFQKQTKNKKQIAFTSLYEKTVNLAHILENNSAARLLITDSGVVAGRFYNAQNKYRKIEGLFRDIASIYFYLYSTKHIVKGLNKLTLNTDIDPKTLEKTLDLLKENLKNNPEEFREFFVGNSENIDKLKDLFNGKKVISVDDFIKQFPFLSDKAKQMAKMQYIENGLGVLSYQQACDVLSNSPLSNPEFLKETYNHTLNKDISDKLRFVSSKHLDKIRASMNDFILQIYKRAKDKNCEINQEFIEKIAKNNLKKSFAFNVIGTIISIFVLGIVIPKIQYAITRKLTNENKFHTEKD